MNPELLHYEIAVSSNRARKDLNSWTNEVKRSSKVQQQAEEAAAHAKEQAARRAAKIKAQLSKLEAKQAKGAHAGEAADHRLRMRALQAELRATTDKTRVLRDVGRARDIEHAKTMRQIRAESAELAKKNQKPTWPWPSAAST